MSPKVSIIILNWNQKHYTIPCIKSLLKSSYRDFEIILVDNGSEKKDIQAIEEEFKGNEKVKIIKNKENRGFAEGNNIGVRNSSPESKYVILVNNDTTASRDWLGEMVGGIESDERIEGMDCCYMPRKGINGSLTLTGFNITHFDDEFEGKEFIPMFYVPGSQFMFDKELIGEPFDPDYFIYGEDIYLGWLIRLKGYEVARRRTSNPNAKFVHYGEHILQKKKSHLAAFLGTRNQLLNLFLFYERKTLLKLIPLIIISQLFYSLYEWRLISIHIKAYIWFIPNIKKLLEKRKKIQKQRKVSDKEIIRIMSCKFMGENKIKQPLFRKITDLTNKFFCVYCKIVGLNSVETYDAT